MPFIANMPISKTPLVSA